MRTKYLGSTNDADGPGSECQRPMRLPTAADLSCPTTFRSVRHQLTTVGWHRLILARAGFTKEAHLLDRLENPNDPIGHFLLMCILAMAAPFTETLVRRYDGALRASEYFATQARALAPSQQYKPNLENTQAFFLLGVYEWAHGRGQLGWVRADMSSLWLPANERRMLRCKWESPYGVCDS